jgi:hypothetical protein
VILKYRLLKIANSKSFDAKISSDFEKTNFSEEKVANSKKCACEYLLYLYFCIRKRIEKINIPWRTGMESCL